MPSHLLALSLLVHEAAVQIRLWDAVWNNTSAAEREMTTTTLNEVAAVALEWQDKAKRKKVASQLSAANKRCKRNLVCYF